jgi:hypothetical protein
MKEDLKIRAALDTLATAPLPVELAGRALTAAARRRAVHRGAGIGALTLVVGVGVGGFLLSPGADRGAQPASAPCVQYTSGSNGPVDVPRADWPEFVAVAVAALPERSDYSMQSGYAWCDFPTTDAYIYRIHPVSAAYAVVNLGTEREAGHLTISVNVTLDPVPDDCTEPERADTSLSLLFCDAATATTPLVYGVGKPGYARVVAIHAGGTAVMLESYGPVRDDLSFGPLSVTAGELRIAVQDRDLVALVPLGPRTP